MEPERYKERCQNMIDLFAKAPIKKALGMTLSYNEKGEAIFRMPHNPNYEHALGDTHGGVIATLLDNAGWFTVAPRYETWVATVEMQMRLLEPALREDLCAMGRIVRAGKTISIAEMQVQGHDGRLIATGSGTFMVTSLSLGGEDG